MSIMDEDEQRIDMPRPIQVTQEVIERFRDLMILKLSGLGLSSRSVGALIGISHQTVQRRLEAIPEATARHYRTASVDSLLGCPAEASEPW